VSPVSKPSKNRPALERETDSEVVKTVAVEASG